MYIHVSISYIDTTFEQELDAMTATLVTLKTEVQDTNKDTLKK